MGEQRKRILTIVTALALMAATACLAFLLGDAVAKASKHSSANKRELEEDKQLLSEMRNIWPGDTIRDLGLFDLDGRTVPLSSRISDKTMLIFFEPDCAACEEEMDEVLEAADDTQELSRFIFIISGSYANTYISEFMAKKSNSLNLLVDKYDSLASRLRVRTFPFNLVVNSDLIVVQPHPRPLKQWAAEQFLE